MEKRIKSNAAFAREKERFAKIATINSGDSEANGANHWTSINSSMPNFWPVAKIPSAKGSAEISHKRFTQLEQRIGAKLGIGPLKKREVLAYLTHRLSVAGLSGELRFTKPSASYLYRKTRASPDQSTESPISRWSGPFSKDAKGLEYRKLNRHSLIFYYIPEWRALLVGEWQGRGKSVLP